MACYEMLLVPWIIVRHVGEGRVKLKLQFRGWQREVNEHVHEVIPIILRRNRYSPQEKGPLEWHNGQLVYGKVENLSLSGNFLVEFHLDPAELGSWLTAYAKEKPEDALGIIAKAQAEAVIALACGAIQDDVTKSVP